jgi:peptidoglycan/LPS O-acetylase OafA/YrhL
MVSKISPHTSNVLDLTRAIAAGLVVLFHARLYVLGGELPPGVVGFVMYCTTNCGTQAVFWFFVISGYLVGGSVLTDLELGRFSFARYLVNRATRLYIVLIPALLLGFLLDHIRVDELGLNYHAGLETPASLSAITLLGNVLFLQTIITPTFGSNYALWSLACEFWYYLLFPLLLVPFFTKKSWVFRLSLIGLGILLYLTLMAFNRSLAWLFVIWCIGVAARLFPFALVKSEVLAWIFAIVALLSFPFTHPVAGFVSTLGVALTFACALNASHGKTWTWQYGRAVKSLGAFSYSLYLIHLPIQHFLLTMPRHNADPFLSLPPFSAIAVATICGLVLTCYAAAFVFAFLTERRTDWLRRRLFQLINAAHKAPKGSLLERRNRDGGSVLEREPHKIVERFGLGGDAD